MTGLNSTHVAVLGLGEAGSLFAAGLAAAGVQVTGWDPKPPADPEVGRLVAGSAAEAVGGADVVLSINAADVAQRVGSAVADHLGADALYADLNTAAPSVKTQVAASVEHAGAEFVDVALLAPVGRQGMRTPAMVSGAGAQRYARLFTGLGAEVEVIDGGPGAAATRKLLRSVFMKGLAGVVLETLEAGRAAGCESWVRGQLAAELDGADEKLLTRLEEGSRQHAPRRVHEMEAAHDLLRELEAPSRITLATLEWLDQLAAEEKTR